MAYAVTKVSVSPECTKYPDKMTVLDGVPATHHQRLRVVQSEDPAGARIGVWDDPLGDAVLVRSRGRASGAATREAQ